MVNSRYVFCRSYGEKQKMLEKKTDTGTIRCLSPTCGRTEMDERVCIFCTSKQEVFGEPINAGDFGIERQKMT